MTHEVRRRKSFTGGGRLRGKSFDHSKGKALSNPSFCSCNTELLSAELKQFRQSSAEAVQNSWNEVETLQQKCANYDEQIQELKRLIELKTVQLQDSLNQAKNLEIELEQLHDVTSPCPSQKGSFIFLSQSQRSLGDQSVGSNVENGTRDNLTYDQESLNDDAQSRHGSLSAEVRRLKLILLSRDNTIEAMEFALSQNVKMM